MTDDFVCLLLSLTFLKPSQKPQTVCNKESRKRCKAEGRGHIGGQQQEGKEKQQIQRHNNIFFPDAVAEAATRWPQASVPRFPGHRSNLWYRDAAENNHC